MRSIDRSIARHHFDADYAEGHRGDARILKALERETTSCFVLTLGDEESVLSLIWHDVPESRILSKDHDLQVGNVARRMLGQSWNFAMLANGDLEGDYQPDYFAKCAAIDHEFDLSRFRWPTLVLPNEGERKRSRNGTLYLMDGTHRMLVLATRILTGRTKFRPIEALLLLPRPDE